jgi:hypothetical protein
MAANQYLSSVQFLSILRDLNLESYDENRQADLLARATGDLEADLSRKYVVPLISADNSSYLNSPTFARNKIVNALRAKTKEILGYDKNRELTGAIESTEKFINVHGIEYKDQLKTLLDPMIDFGFLLLNQAKDAQTPVQHIGLSRADNRTKPFGWDDDDCGGSGGGGFGGWGAY